MEEKKQNAILNRALLLSGVLAASADQSYYTEPPPPPMPLGTYGSEMGTVFGYTPYSRRSRKKPALTPIQGSNRKAAKAAKKARRKNRR